MNNDRMEGAWKQMRGKMKQAWGKLTDDDLDRADGKWDELSGMIQSRYGRKKEEAEEEIKRFRDEHDRETSRDIAR
ncbi:MAG: CsbD family protein [Gemmatimonadota bacterium]